jgi:hypothetical protein
LKIVKAVLGSGGEVIASSNGFYIDITPPVFDEQVMMYIDVRQGEFTPSDFQGSNNTIKALWLCNDDKSEIGVNSLFNVIHLLSYCNHYRT